MMRHGISFRSSYTVIANCRSVIIIHGYVMSQHCRRLSNHCRVSISVSAQTLNDRTLKTCLTTSLLNLLNFLSFVIVMITLSVSVQLKFCQSKKCNLMT